MNVAEEVHVAVHPATHAEQDVEILEEDFIVRVVLDIVYRKAQCAQVGISWGYT